MNERCYLSQHQGTWLPQLPVHFSTRLWHHSAMMKEDLRTPTDFPCTSMTDRYTTMTFLGQRTAEESFAVMRVVFPCPTVYSLFQMAAVACKPQTREAIQISLQHWFLMCTISLLMSYWWSNKVSVMTGGSTASQLKG